MATVISDDFKAQFVTDKCLYDSMSQAIKLAKTNGYDEKDIKPLIIEKQNLKTKCSDNVAKFIKRMTLSQNIVDLGGSWYAVRYVNEKGDSCLKVDLIHEKDLSLLRRDGRYERELSRSDLDALLPSLVNEPALEMYKQELQVKASQLLDDVLGISVDVGITQEEIDASKPITVSTHAGRRWVQRRLGIKSEEQAEDYRRAHYREVNDSILSGFENSEVVWTSDDGVEFYFDADNIMYVVGNNTIITLYEEDFGFAKEINRMITLKQLEVLKDVYGQLNDSIKAQEDNVGSIEDNIRTIADEMDMLQAQLNLLASHKEKLLAEREQSGRAISVARAKYVAEFNKLFKKWDA